MMARHRDRRLGSLDRRPGRAAACRGGQERGENDCQSRQNTAPSFRSPVTDQWLSRRPSIDSMNADVIILTGPPGAGKATTAGSLVATYAKSVHLHTDDFWHYISSGAIPPYLPESEEQNQVVMRVIRQAAFMYAAGGFTTVIDGIVGPWMLDHFRGLNDAPPLHYVVLRPELDERAQGRTTPDALTDQEPIVSLWGQFADLGPLERHAIETTHQQPVNTMRPVADANASEHFLLDTAAD